VAEELDGTARDDRWQRLVGLYPFLADYAGRTTRRIPVLLLTRAPAAGA
jgi:hypothetical protein